MTPPVDGPTSPGGVGDDPWSVPASWDVEKKVAFESGGVRLSGTLYSPEGIEDGPAVVVVQQAGTETRDTPLFVQIAETFPAIGFSVFLYDRRGHGESEGDPARPSYGTMAEDAVAAKRAIAERRAVMGEYYRGERSYESAHALLAEIEDQPWFELTFMPGADELPEDVQAGSWIHEMRYNPVPAFEGVEAPMLFLLGGEDFDVPVARTLEIAQGLGERDGREIVVLPGASHLMRIEAEPADQLDLEPDDVSDSPEYFLVMGEWLGRLALRPN